MMVPIPKERPKCIVCGEPARGRVCYLGVDEKVVDNMWCLKHEWIVYRATCESLEKRFEMSKGEWVVIQRWLPYETIPDLPEDQSQLFKDGVRRSKVYANY